jgi:methionyl-tRNA synthetase
MLTSFRTGNQRDKEDITSTIYACAESLRIVGILLQSYMPSKMSQLLDMLGVDEARRTFDYAVVGADDSYGDPKLPLGRNGWDSLFPPLPVED